MINRIIVSKLISLVKVALFTMLSLAVTSAYAEYYVVYSAVELGGCATPACSSSPCKSVVTHKYKKYYKRHTCKTYRTYKRPSTYNVATYYVWPMYAGTLWVPKCGGECMQWQPGYCRTMDCQDFYVPPQYYSYDREPYMDMRTSDDF